MVAGRDAAAFAPYPNTDTTLPAFDAAWAARNQGHAIGIDYDLRVRRSFFVFGKGRDVGRPEALLDNAREAALDTPAIRA